MREPSEKQKKASASGTVCLAKCDTSGLNDLSPESAERILANVGTKMMLKVSDVGVDISRIRSLLKIEPFDDDGVPCCTVSVKGLGEEYGACGRTFRLGEKDIAHVLDSDVTVLWLHEHFEQVVGSDYLNLLASKDTIQ